MYYTRDPSDHQGLPRHCRGKDRQKHYNPNTDRPSQILGKEDRNCAGDYQAVWCSSHTRSGLGQEQKGRDRSAWAGADKLKTTEDHLKTWHDNIDQSYIVKANRYVLKILHNVMYPTGKTNTKTNQRLHHIVDTAEIRKFISGENTGDEDEWKTNLWQVPTVQVWSNLLFKFEDFTDMINGEFVNDLTGLLHDVTTSGKTQTFYNVDAKIATMGLTICKNFKEVPVFWNFFQDSVRQSMIQSLAANGQDKEAWRKAEDKIADLLHDNTMLTLENTSDTVKYTETYLNREITNPDNHVSVLKTDVSDSKEILALKVELAEVRAAQVTVTTTQGGGNRRFNGKSRRDGGARTADKTVVDVCKTCGHRHPGRSFWTEGEEKREQGLALLQETDSILAMRSINWCYRTHYFIRGCRRCLPYPHRIKKDICVCNSGHHFGVNRYKG
jgi:hypothetical protein